MADAPRAAASVAFAGGSVTGGSAQQQPQAQATSAWAALGQSYSGQVLAFMISITDAQAMVRRMRGMRPGPPLHLPAEVECMDVWQVLGGCVAQQQVWAFGTQQPAVQQPEAPAGDGDDDAAAPKEAAATLAAQQPCVSCREPVSIKEGVRFSSCAAGQQHTVAATEGGAVFVFGSNDKGQLGCDTSAQAPVAVHVLSAPAAPARSSARGHGQPVSHAKPPVSAAAACLYRGSDTLKQLANLMKLPPSLTASLAQQRHLEQRAVTEQTEQQQLLLAELLAQPQLGQQQQLAGAKHAGWQPAAACAAAHAAVAAGISLGARSTQQQPLPPQQQQQQQQQVLCVYRLNLGAAVRCIACGSHHTLAALASSGLIAFGANDKGQCGLPGMFKQVAAPMRVHNLEGQRLLVLSAGAKHSAAVQEGGQVVTWGHGRHGRLGVGGAPDVMPPSVVAGLRGCTVTQVACGTAHTLALTADGRVYACGFNGQGALGTGDQQDRLYPTLVPGLPRCVRVAAAAGSMALSSSGQVFTWGGTAGRLLALRAPPSSSGSGSSSGSSSGGGESAAPAVPEKQPLPWLEGKHISHVACGVDTAAAVSSAGEVMMWGDPACLPPSMSRSQLLAAPPPQAPAAAGTPDKAQAGDAAAAGCQHQQQVQQAPSRQQQQQHARPQPATGFNPQREPVSELACGASHHALLCQPSQHTPTADETRIAILAVLRAYIASFNSTNTSSLNLLMLQQACRGGVSGWGGSIIGGGHAKSTCSVRPGGYAASVASFTASTTSSAVRAFKAARAATVAAAAAGNGGSSPGAASGSSPDGSPQDGRSVRCSSPDAVRVVSFSGGAGNERSAPFHMYSSSGSTAAGCGPLDAKRGGAFSACAALVGGGSISGRVLSASALAGQGRRASDGGGGGGGAAPCDSLSLHGALLLCHEVGLLDNITEHLDVIEAFQLMLHRKRGRLGPAQHSNTPATAAQDTTPAPAAAGSGGHQQPGSPASSPEPTTLTVVLRPGQPAAAAAAPAQAEVSRPASRPCSPGLPEHYSAAGSRLESRGKFGQRAISRAAAAASGMDSITTLDAGEVLELLLLLMKERHPCYRREPLVLLTLLAGWHMARLQERRPDKGPPWLLRQVLQPDILCTLESPDTTGLLHGLFVHVAGSSGNPQDLTLNIADLRMGLKFAAGRRTLQEYEQEQQHQAGLCRSSSSTGSRRLGQQQSSRYQDSTQASTGHTLAGERVPRSLSLSRLSAGAGSSTSSGPRRFELPLCKLAAFIRTAKLLPRLLEKYISQLQLRGQEQQTDSKGARLDGLRVMPCLQVAVPFMSTVGAAAWAGGSQPGLRHRSQLSSFDGSSDGWMQQQRQGVAGSRLTPLKELSTASSLCSSAGPGQPSSVSCDAFLDALPSPDPLQPRLGTSSRSLLLSTSRLAASLGTSGSVAMLPRQRACAEPSSTARGKRQQVARAADSAAAAKAAANPLFTGEDGFLDAALLDSCELAPLRSNTATIALAYPSPAAARRPGSSSSGGSVPRALLPLPPAAAPGISSSWADGSAAPHFGGAALQQVLHVMDGVRQLQQASGQQRSGSAHKATYQQQQAALKQAQLAAEAAARAAEAQDIACQDAWIVLLLVELLGSHLVRPAWRTAVTIPPPAQQPPPASSSSSSPQVVPAGVPCSWDRGYRFDGAADAAASSDGSSLGSSTSATSLAVSVDLLNATISYPQFVEVLLCLMAARSTVLLEPEVKQLRQLELNEEMQDHACVLLGRITQWRAAQLTPWKAPRKQQSAGGGANGSSRAEAATGRGSKGGGGQQQVLLGTEALARIYASYSSCRTGGTVLALRKEGWLQMLRDGGVLTAGGRCAEGACVLSLRLSQLLTAKLSTARWVRDEVSAAAAAAVFTKATGAVPQAAANKHSSTGVAGNSSSSNGAAGTGDRPQGMGGGQRQSTFMRCVTQQLAQRLEAPSEGADAQGAPAVAAVAAVEVVSPGITSLGADAGHQLCQTAEGTVAASKPPSEPCTPGSTAATSAERSPDSSATASCESTRPTASVGSAQPGSVREAPVLTFAQFLQGMQALSRLCFPRIANGARAWQLLVERHVQPLADSKRGRISSLTASLSTPSVVALLMAWQQQLSELFATATAQATAAGALPALAASSQTPQLSLAAFMQLLQDRGAIPQLLEPTEIQEVLKQLLVMRPDVDTVFCSLDRGQFTQALALCGLAVFMARRMQHSALTTPERQLAAFLGFMGLQPLPGQEQLLAGAPAGAQLPLGAKGRSEGKSSGMRQQQQQQQLALDPYVEWWSLSLQLDTAAESRAHDHLSSLSYMPVMLQEVVRPPEGTPDDVLSLLAAAQAAQQAHDITGALDAYEQAAVAWRGCLQPAGSSTQPEPPREETLPPAAELYFAVSAASCLLACGQDADAAAVLTDCADVLQSLHEAGADAAVWHAAAAVAKFHCQDLQGAFEHCVRAYVIRLECGALGPAHIDTQTAGHNLGVVLDCLGKCGRGLQLVEGARQVFAASLGPQHPRTLIAARNAMHTQHKLIKLPAEAGEPQGLQGAAGGADDSSSGSDGSDSSNEKGSGRRRKQQRGGAGERLSAVVRRGHKGQPGRQQQQQRERLRDYTDIDELGAGVRRASAEARQLFRALQPDIAQHAAGASLAADGVLELQTAAAATVSAGSRVVVKGPVAADATVACQMRRPLSTAQARVLRRRQQLQQKEPELLDKLLLQQ